MSKLPTRLQKSKNIEKLVFGNKLILGSTNGLKKERNEDAVGYFSDKNISRICIADGHWGNSVSQFIIKYWLNPLLKFPKNIKESRREAKKIEYLLYKKFGKPSMNEEKDFTPEASFIVTEISDNNVRVVSYGDCRMLIANGGNLKFKMKVTDTWIGAFSYLGLRGRIPSEKATLFKKIKLVKNDCIFLFTDGVDQCIYEKDTISLKEIASLSKNDNLNNAFNIIFKKIFNYGAEDNASIAIYKYS